MSPDYALLDVRSFEYNDDPTPGSNKQYAGLTDRLGCKEVRMNTFLIPPGEEGPYHRHEVQEELYVLLDGPGRMKVDGEVVDVAEGGVVRVPPELPRTLVNDSDDVEQRWLAMGAPPVVSVEDGDELVVVDE